MNRLAAFLVAMIVCLYTPNVGAQAEVIGGTVAVDQLAGSIADELQEVIRQLENTASRLMMEARTHAIVTAGNVEFLGEKLAGKVFDELDDTQKRAFQSARQLIADFKAGNLEAIAKAGDVVTRLESAIATLPLSRTFPRVLDYSPSYFVASDVGDTVQISAKGSWLGYDEPTLAFGDAPCKLMTKIETALSFECPSSAIADTPVRMASGVLTVFEERNFWEQLVGFFGSNRKPVEYQVGITGMPREIGSYAAVAHVEEAGEERRTRTEEFRADNDHCWGAQQKQWAVNADVGNGWQIDVAVAPTPTIISLSSKSSFQGIANLAASGFSVNGTVTNNGDCGPKRPFSSSRLWYDGRGHVHVKVSFEEFRTVPVVNAKDIAGDTFLWRKDVTVNLPERTKAFTITVETVEPRTIVVTEPGDYGWFMVEYDPDARVVVLRPKQAEAALAS